MAKYEEGDHVEWRGMNVTGKVRRVRTGPEHGGDLYTVYADDHKAVPGGMFVAREGELQWGRGAKKPATDSARKAPARLHRALDAVLDRAKARDGERELFKVGDHVKSDLGTGVVRRVRIDDNGRPIYTVFMDDPHATASGILYARNQELKAAAKDRIPADCLDLGTLAL